MRRNRLSLVAVSACLVATIGASIGSGAPDSGVQQEGDWIALCDGKTLAGWTDLSGQPPSNGWEVVDGAIHRKEARAGHLISDRQFDNFELRFEWKVAKGGNSGVKYRTAPVPKKGLVGCEYQLLDDDNHPNGGKATTRCGALYDLYAPDEAAKVLAAEGTFNESRIIARGSKIEHWLNGRKILDVDTTSADWKERIAKSKFKALTDFAAEHPSPILIQDHNSEVWFRNLAIRPLP